VELLLAVPVVVRRPDGLIAYVIESDGVTATARWVGPFPDARTIVAWIETRAVEIEEWFTPSQLGLPTELAVLRPVAEQVAACRTVGETPGDASTENTVT
jgi:hypothetical protein